MSDFFDDASTGDDDIFADVSSSDGGMMGTTSDLTTKIRTSTKDTRRQRSNNNNNKSRAYPQVPHDGSLCRIEQTSRSATSLSYRYMIEILLENDERHQLWYEPQDFEFMKDLFAILDTESRGEVGKAAMEEFVTQRCPVFWRRDEDLRKLNGNQDMPGSPTFEEVWYAVLQCGTTGSSGTNRKTRLDNVVLGVEGWIVFCRFIALAQYLEAKRRFSARHLQQTMRHRNAPRGSELVVVDVPPPAPPIKLTPVRLADHERKGKAPLPLPELDLDHSLIAAHDALRRRSMAPTNNTSLGTVKVVLFGTKPKPGNLLSSGTDIEFAVTYSTTGIMGEEVIVRRSFSDMKWLNETFNSHRGMGGTLCGRILPPFPPTPSTSLATQFKPDDKTLQTAIDGTGAAVKAAAAGVGILTSAAKSFWGRSFGDTTNPEVKSTPKPQKKKTAAPNVVISEKYYNPNSASAKARNMERYLNYLLEHPALSTSFPLSTILKASQSGLEAAKLFLEHHAKAKQQHVTSQPPQIDDWRTTVTGSTGSTQSSTANLAWVRTAAQAAMALKVHGFLETTGLPSASARLQHASLPNFNQSARQSGWADDEDDTADQNPSIEGDGSVGVESFEHGVIQVEDDADADDGYDLLPLPIPAPERRILCAGSAPGTLILDANDAMSMAGREERFHYGIHGDRVNLSEQCEVESAFLGDFPVDENIDKLREVIGSVDNTLSRCLSACGGIGEARRERLTFHSNLVQGFDSWEGLRGRFFTQRAMLKGIEGLEQSKEVAEESDLEIVDDISWQASLASSAVTAAEDVRSTVRAARTAASAKAAADSAAFAAQSACEGDFHNIDEARTAQTRASIAQSHAIHAAVVEHEANTAKRRAALALAHDVKCWNVHRKREMLNSCLSYAKSQHVATRRAVDAWSCLRDGYLGSTIIPEGRLPNTSDRSPASSMVEQTLTVPGGHVQDDEPVAQIYAEVSGDMSSVMGSPSIQPVDHQMLPKPATSNETKLSSEESNKPLSSIEEEEHLPIVDAAPIAIAESGGDDTEPSENVLSSSMQSLVDGLMSWGGQYDSEEDLNLPVGMAASIVLEGSGIGDVN